MAVQALLVVGEALVSLVMPKVRHIHLPFDPGERDAHLFAGICHGHTD
jgi:hypothetical protein